MANKYSKSIAIPIGCHCQSRIIDTIHPFDLFDTLLGCLATALEVIFRLIQRKLAAIMDEKIVTLIKGCAHVW